MRGFCEGVFVSHLDNVCVIALIWKHSYFEKVHKINLGTLPNKRGEKIIDENRKEMENFERRKGDRLCRWGTSKTYAEIVGKIFLPFNSGQ